MRIIDKFVDFVENYNYTDGGFVIEGDEGKARFTTMKVGNAEFVYGRRVYGDGIPELEDVLKLVAIISWGGTIYIVDPVILSPYIFKDGKNNIKYPTNSIRIEDYNINDWVRKNVFPEFYKSLPIVELDSYTQKTTLFSARAELLGVSECTSSYKLDEYMVDVFDIDEYPKILAGTIDVKGESYERLKKLKDYYSTKKTKVAVYNEMLNNGKSFYQTWEKYMAEALKSVINSNYVTVELKSGTKTSTVKINTRSLLISLIEQNEIGCTAFDTIKNCERAEKDLCVHAVKCDYISKIAYRGKTIYKKVQIKED